MKLFSSILIIAALFIGCGGKKSLVVLVPDPSGEVGSITVSNPRGSQVLSEAYTATEVGEKKAPGSVRAMSEKEIETTFKDAINARPEASATYILYFVAGTTSLTEASLEHLQQAREEIKRRLPCEVYIAGHTDTKGSKEINFRLSLERAEIVKGKLIEIGVDPTLIQVSAHGEDDPLILTGDEVDEPRNRRVEVFIR